MRVHFGPYKNWVGPYQVSDWFQKIGFSEETCDGIGDWLAARKYFVNFLEWISKRRKRKIEVRIDDYDTWGMYETLSVIIAPMLRQLKESKHGYPMVDNKDVPVELRTKGKKLTDKDEAKWDWVLNEMIFAFEQYEARVQVDYDWEEQFSSGEIDMQMKEVEMNGVKLHTLEKGPNHTYQIDTEGMKKYSDRIKNGFELFGKYYLNLWD